MEHRKGNWAKVVENMKKMLVIFPDLGVRMTYTPKTVGRLAINVQFLHQEVGIQKIMHHAVMEAEIDEILPTLMRQFIKFFELQDMEKKAEKRYGGWQMDGPDEEDAVDSLEEREEEGEEEEEEEREEGNVMLFDQVLYLKNGCGHLNSQVFYFFTARYDTTIVIAEYHDGFIA